MLADGYRFGTHLDVPNLVEQLTHLSNAAFATYEGAMEVDETFTAWYLRRPGCRPELCPVALCGDRLVSNVLVAIQPLQLGGEVIPCGIVDTVATDPDHQQRGLARRLMTEAHRVMQEAEAEAAVLYTNPEGHPYRFYQRLGYQTRAFGEALLGFRPEAVEGIYPEMVCLEAGRQLWPLLDAYYSDCDGYCAMSEAQWRWHRVGRPATMPCQVYVVRDDEGRLLATVAFAEAELRVGGETVKASVLSDFASVAGDSAFLEALLARAPHERVAAFVDVQSPLYRMLIRLGFRGFVREAAMILPFTDRARGAVARLGASWYYMIESLVGV